MQIKFPVVYFVFKRPAFTTEFLNLFKSAGINKIYIYADGPRNSADKVVTDQVAAHIKSFIADNPDITVMPNFSDNNLGLKQNIIAGLTKVFATEAAAIVVEDDCLPTTDFLMFASQMLTQYKDDSRVMSVNGTSPGGQFGGSYDFTKYPQCWGWATWARAWKLYDPSLSQFSQSTWPQVSKSLGLSNLMGWYWYHMLTLVKSDWISTWDFQWSFAHFYHHGLAIAPSVNMIKNIGFDSVATNTKTKTSASSMAVSSLTFPLTHPSAVVDSLSVSHQIESSFYGNPVAILGMLRQYIYFTWNSYVHRH